MSLETNYMARRTNTQSYINKIGIIEQKIKDINAEIATEKSKEVPANNPVIGRIEKDGIIRSLNEKKTAFEAELTKLKDQLEDLSAGLENTVSQLPANSNNAINEKSEKAHTNLNTLLTSIETQIKEASAMMPTIASDWEKNITKSPLSYLIYTNNSLISKAKTELSNIKQFTTRRNNNSPIEYAKDAKFPQIVAPKSRFSFFGRKGGAAKTVRNRKVKRAA
jgi:hypothetical protein